MRHILNILFVISAIILTACKNNDREPQITPLTIHREFKTESMPVKLSEVTDIKEYKDRMFIVNSIDDLPDDPQFGVADFQQAGINFADYSLIITYQLIPGYITGYKYGWAYDNWFERYQFYVSLIQIKDSEFENGEIENFTYFRSAILVKRIPTTSSWVISLSTTNK